MNDYTKYINKNEIITDFIRYVKIDTQADADSKMSPSTEKQKKLSLLLVDELQKIGINNAHTDDYGYVYAYIESNCDNKDYVAFIAHLDTAMDESCLNINPQIHYNYDMTNIRLNADIIFGVDYCKGLDKCLGHTIITTDGTTLLGGDDKAGIVEIMQLVKILRKRPEIKHPGISICFTPDEEIGKGTEHIDLNKINAKYAYTLDGSQPYKINVETFTAWEAKINFVGQSSHPGDAKGNMVNAGTYLAEFVHLLPCHFKPEQTSEREAFIHVTNMQAKVSEAQCVLILRAFCDNKIKEAKKIIEIICNQLRLRDKRLKITIDYIEQYRNMGEIIDKNPESIEVLVEAIKNLGVMPEIEVVRGGTDGSKLSFMGLPCPNIFNGSSNHHELREWVSVENMEKTVELLLEVLNILSKK